MRIVALCLVWLISSIPSRAEVSTLAGRMESLISLPNGYPVRHCRFAGNPITGGNSWSRCRQRLHELAVSFEHAGRTYGIESSLLAGMAFQETGFNPFAEGSAGERGIAQLHPRGIGSYSRFVRDDSYRASCERRYGACQHDVILLQAEHLSDWIGRCEGNIKKAIGGYNSGRCEINQYVNLVWKYHLVLR